MSLPQLRLGHIGKVQQGGWARRLTEQQGVPHSLNLSPPLQSGCCLGLRLLEVNTEIKQSSQHLQLSVEQLQAACQQLQVPVSSPSFLARSSSDLPPSASPTLVTFCRPAAPMLIYSFPRWAVRAVPCLLPLDTGQFWFNRLPGSSGRFILLTLPCLVCIPTALAACVATHGSK